ncbi:MAG: hypothetical protein OEQ14_06285 [Gammaproteobacteria bacterium]|nr:hypothetical protein [Gammaproteobacteria bacterium]
MKGFILFILILASTALMAQGGTGTLDTYRDAAKLGDPVAQFNVGLIFYEGRGVPKDHEKALKWFRQASKKGNPAAQYYLGLFFDKGIGVEKDPEKAEKWYRLAAEKGYVHQQEAPQQDAPQQDAPQQVTTQQESPGPKMSSGPSISSDQAKTRGGLLYKGTSKKPYTGMVQDRYDNGAKEEHYVNGKRHGPSIGWGANGAVQSKSTYVDGQAHGLLTYWYANGQKSFEVDFVNGQKEGVYTSWHRGGQTKSEVNYVNGKQEGLEIAWHANGEKASETNYVHGVKQGTSRRWHENGQKAAEVDLLDGKEVGTGFEWYDTGEKSREFTAVHNIRYYRNGNKSSESKTLDAANGIKAVASWYENGNKKSEGTDKGGYRQGLWTEYYENGQKKSEETRLLDDRAELEALNDWGRVYWSEWYENGQQKSEGFYVSYHPPYMRDAQGRPFTPTRHGYWRDWDPDGKETGSCYRAGSKRADLRSCLRLQVPDKVNQVAALLYGAAKLTDDAGGFSGQAGDRAVDLGMGGKRESVLIGDANFLNAATADADEVTFSIWIKRHDVANSSVMWADSPSSGGIHRGVQFHVPWGDNVIYFDTTGCCNESDSRIQASVETFPGYSGGTQWWNEWHHFVFSKEGTHKEIWIDGQLFVEGENSNPLPSDFVQIWLGNLEGHSKIPDSNRQFRGMLDDYSIFGTALGAADIVKLTAGDAPTTLGDDAKLLAYWDFNELGPLIVPNDVPLSLITN